MSIELKMLVWSVVLGLATILIVATFSAMARGGKWAAGARDEIKPPLAGIGGRLERAQRNFLETFPLFAVAVLVLALLDRHSHDTELGAQLYFWGRLLYVPLYATGIYALRSIAWAVALVGIVMLLIQLLH